MMDMVAYWAPKQGTAFSDWEDGAAYNRCSGWFAVADGASTGINSREWAYTLTGSFISNRPERALTDPATGFDEWVEMTRAGFDPGSRDFLPSTAPLWVQAEGSKRGAYATLLAGRIAAGTLRAIAVGDCCLFLVRAAGRVESFPLTSPQDFDAHPQLVSSLPVQGRRPASPPRPFERDLEAGDVVYVASDALAQWLTGQRGNPAVWHMLSGIGNAGFRDLCADLWDGKHMKNDDITLLRAKFGSVEGRH